MLTGEKTEAHGGHYSNKFKLLEQGRMKEVEVEHARQLAARERARKLSVETNRRRRALETKKKLEAQREAKRRQEVLDERHQRQKDATNRFQRLNKRKNRRNGPQNHTAPVYPGAPLQDGVILARGYRLDSPHSTSCGTGTPSLDEVLQMVGVPSSLSLKYGQGQPAYQPNGVTPSSAYPIALHHNGSYVDSGANVTAGNGVRTQGNPVHSTVHSVASQGRVDSRAGHIEQEIAEQQHQLLAQQQRTLQEFSQAIQNEARNGVGGIETLHRSGSLSSVDSLEENNDMQKHNGNMMQHQNSQGHIVYTSKGFGGISQYSSHSESGSGTAGGYHQTGGHHPLEDVPANYSLYHNDVLMRGSLSKQDNEMQNVNPINGSNNTMASQMTGSNGTSYRTAHENNNGDKNLTAVYSQAGHSNGVHHRTANDVVSKENPASAQAWSSSITVKPPLQQHASIPTASIGQRSRPYSARTTATAVTVSPAVSYVGNFDSQGKRNVASDKSLVIATNDAPSTEKLQQPRHPQCEFRVEDLSRRGTTPGAEQSQAVKVPKGLSPTKSILKRPQSDSLSRDRKTSGLAAAIVKDSLEIGKRSGIKSQKKGVRWTDITYSDDESVGTHVTTENATPAARKPKLISGVSAKTVQERMGNRVQTVGAGTPPRPKSGNSNAIKERGSVPVKNNPFPRGTESQQHSCGKETISDKSQPVIQNGIRLDKTPTDEEINWLWDKVRTCLNTRDESGDPGIVADVSTTGQSTSASQHQDQRITANLRVAPPANKPRFSHHQDTLRRHTTVPRWRTSSDSGSHMQQSAMFQQRRPHVRSSSASRGNGPPVSENSQQVAARLGTTAPKAVVVTDSLMTFQQAEQMAQQNADDADIAAVIEQQRPYQTHFEQKVNPSALSIEEAKILESLDRLNARLKTVTAEMNGSFNPIYPVMPPRPPAYGGGFRGHRPMSSRPGVHGGTRPNHRARAHSADRSSVRMGHHR